MTSVRRRVARAKDRLKRHDLVRRAFRKAPLTPRGRWRRARGLAAVPVGLVNPPSARHDQPPVVLVAMLGADGATVTSWVHQVARAQMEDPFAPVFVVTTDEFDALRNHGYLFEYIPPPDEWGRLDHDQSWEAFLAQRLATLVEEYGPDTIISVPTSGEGSAPLFRAAARASQRLKGAG